MSKTALSFEMSAVLETARAAYLDGRLADSEQGLRQVLAQYPNNADAQYLLGAIAYRNRDYDMSARMMHRVVALQPRHHDALLTLGMALRAQKKPREALPILQKAAMLKPSSLDNRFHLALAEIEAGDLKAAAKHLERATKIDPENASVRNTYAGVLFQLGEREESLRQLRKGAQIAADVPDMQQNLAVALQTAGQHEEAVEQFRKVLSLAPDHFDAMYGLANSLTTLRLLDEAYGYFENLLRQGPKMVPPRSNYALALRHGGRVHDSIEQFRTALKDSNGEPFVAANLAESLVLAGEIDEAQKVLRDVAAKRPGEGLALQLGDLLARLGRFTEAGVQYEHVLHRSPENAVALVAIADIQGKDLSKAAEERLLGVANADRRAAGDVLRAHLALGRVYDVRGDYARAFEHFRLGNQVRNAVLPFDVGNFRAWITKLIATFTPDLVANLAKSASQSDVPVFVVGLARTGSAIIERMIAAHPQGHGLGEPQDLYVLARRLTALTQHQSASAWGSYSMSGDTPVVINPATREYPDCLRELSADTVAKVSSEFVSLRQRHAPKARRIADKSAAHWQFIGLARALLPRASVLHVTRDPADTLFSIWSNHIGNDHNYPSDLSALGVYFREYQRLMAHWKALAPISEVRYEDLVTSPEAAAKSVLSAVGLPWDANVMKFAEMGRIAATHSRARIRQPLDRASIGRAKNYAQFLKPLTDSLK